MAQPRTGGSFAPPLDATKLAAYRALAESAPSTIKAAMLPLCDMVEAFQETPASTKVGAPHPSGVGLMIPLEDAEVKRIWDLVPWDGQTLEDGTIAPKECDMLADLFESLPTGTSGEAIKDGVRRAVVSDPKAKALRDAAFHLLWYAKELTRDREPMTSDKL